jgi:hypothetical protein
VTADEAESPAPTAAPQHCLVLPSAHSELAAHFPWMVSEAVRIRVDYDSALGATARGVENPAARADADLAEFTAALRRARGQGEAS